MPFASSDQNGMAGPPKIVQIIDGLNDSADQRIKMNISDKLQHISFFLTKDGFISVLV